MTVMTAETLAVNGVILNTLAKNIETLTGRLRAAAIRTDNVSVPGRHGTLRTTRKFYSETQLVLPMWVRGCDDNGLVTSTGRAQFFANLDALTKVFRPGDGMLEVVHTLPDGSSRRAMAEVTEMIDFSIEGNSGNMPLGKFSVALRIPSVFWEDTSVLSIDLPVTQNGGVAMLDGTTAPIEDATFTIVGPATNPRVEALYNGASLQVPNWFQYSGTVAAGQTLVVNCATWSLSGTGGFTPNFANFSHSGGSRWLTIVPGPVGLTPSLKVTASATTGASKVNLSTRRKYLVG